MSAPPWAWTPSGGTTCSATSMSGEGGFARATASRPTGSSTPATCWREEGCWPETEGPTSGLRPDRGPRSSWTALRRIEDAAVRIGGVEVINVCLRKVDVKAYEKVSLDRLLNRINASVKAAGRHAFLIFDEGKERMITRAYRRLRIFNPVPSRYERWEEGERTRNIPVENVIGGPRLPKLRWRPPAPDGRPNSPRAAQAGGDPRPQGGEHGHPRSLLHPRPCPQPERVAPGPPGDRQEVRGNRRPGKGRWCRPPMSCVFWQGMCMISKAAQTSKRRPSEKLGSSSSYPASQQRAMKLVHGRNR